MNFGVLNGAGLNGAAFVKAAVVGIALSGGVNSGPINSQTLNGVTQPSNTVTTTVQTSGAVNSGPLNADVLNGVPGTFTSVVISGPGLSGAINSGPLNSGPLNGVPGLGITAPPIFLVPSHGGDTEDKKRKRRKVKTVAESLDEVINPKAPVPYFDQQDEDDMEAILMML